GRLGVNCQSYALIDAARTRTSTLSSSMTGLATSLSSRTSGEPYFSRTTAFIVVAGAGSSAYMFPSPYEALTGFVARPAPALSSLPSYQPDVVPPIGRLPAQRGELVE